MKFPSKFISYKESSISKFPIILKELKEYDLSVKELYRKIKSSVDNYQEFIEILDCLFILGKIEFIEEVLHYVKIN